MAEAEAALTDIERAKLTLKAADYEELHGLFYRTLLTARIHRAVAGAYLGFRLWCKGPAHRTDLVMTTVQNGLTEIQSVIPLIRYYPGHVPEGQWDWTADADRAERYFKQIAVDGWPHETNGSLNPEGGLIFPYE